MLTTQQKRPRNLSWIHAGPLLFGDWGTSRLYVLGLAFYYTAHASPAYLAAMSLLMIAVAWAYTVICRCFPEGGGVYSAARSLSPTLAVVGGTLLICDYAVTASLSTLEAFHYFGLPSGPGGWLIVGVSVFTILLVGVLNWLGAKASGQAAMVVALLAVGVSLVMAVFCVPLAVEGLRTVNLGTGQNPVERWQSFVHIVLALSGVEAVANMTGIMKQPVARTARRTIWPVLIEVAILNLIFGLALNGLPGLIDRVTPDYLLYGKTGQTPPDEVAQYMTTAMRVLAEHTLGHTFSIVVAIVFGVLLLSAANTAIMGTISVLYAMAGDKELPRGLRRLNYSGVPVIPLLFAVSIPVIVLLFERDLKHLADLYAVGVVGAITINVGSCSLNRKLDITRWERRCLGALGILMLGIEITILITKPHATLFAGGMIAAVLVARRLTQQRAARTEVGVAEPATGWLAEIQGQKLELDPSMPKIMLAARGGLQAEFAVDMARRRRATLFAIHVRTLRVSDLPAGQVPRIEDDPLALEGLGTVAVLAKRAGVPFFPIYVCSENIAEEILDYTVTFGCDTLIMGKTGRVSFRRAFEGDVVAEVARHLPEECVLITRAATKHPVTWNNEPQEPDEVS